MSKKLKTRLILVLVLAIWGYNGYRVYMNQQVEQQLEEQEQVHSSFNPMPVAFNKDSFELVLPETDPFLKKKKKSH